MGSSNMAMGCSSLILDSCNYCFAEEDNCQVVTEVGTVEVVGIIGVGATEVLIAGVGTVKVGIAKVGTTGVGIIEVVSSSIKEVNTFAKVVDSFIIIDIHQDCKEQTQAVATKVKGNRDFVTISSNRRSSGLDHSYFLAVNSHK